MSTTHQDPLRAALAAQLDDAGRTVAHDANNEVDVRLTRTFDVPISELWAALTDPGRLVRWFSPIEGEPGEGGTVRLVAMGVEARVLACAPPRTATLTWGIGGDASVLDLQLDAHAEHEGATTLSVRHHVGLNEHYETYGPAATGAGWDGAMLGLALHLADPTADPVAEMARFPLSEDGLRFTADCCAAWERADVAAGTAAETAHRRAEATSAFYRGEA